MSDDFRSWSSGNANAKRIGELYTKLSPKEKAEVKPLMVKGQLLRESWSAQIKKF